MDENKLLSASDLSHITNQHLITIEEIITNCKSCAEYGANECVLFDRKVPLDMYPKLFELGFIISFVKDSLGKNGIKISWK